MHIVKHIVKKCTILQVCNDSVDCTFHLGCDIITEVSVVKDFGVSVDNLLKFNSHISQITACASARANLIHKCFVSKDISTMNRAFVVYVRPVRICLLCLCVYTLQDIKCVESVQRRFTKRLPGMFRLKYTARRTSLDLETLELKRWHHDLVLTYKILFGKLDTDCMDMFTVRSQSITHGHQWKLFANHCRVDARKHFSVNMLLLCGTVYRF